MLFQERLRKYREAAGYESAKDFAMELGIPYSSYMAYENKKREPKYDVLMEIADKLGITIDDLLGYVPHNNASRIFNQYRAIGASVSKSITDKGFIVQVRDNRYWIKSEVDLAIVYDSAMKDEALIKDVKRMKAIALEMALFKYRKVGVKEVRIKKHSTDSFAGEIKFSSPIGWKDFSADIVYIEDNNTCLSIYVDSLGHAFPDEIIHLLKDDIAFYVAKQLEKYYDQLPDTNSLTANSLVVFADELHAYGMTEDENGLTEDEKAKLIAELHSSKEAETNEPHPNKKE